MKNVRTRYAPSPTGLLHIGGARTALFCYLFAKHYKGRFIVRIEDTDQGRNIEGGEKSQIDNLMWLGIIPDEYPQKPVEKYGPYRQSQKLKRYKTIIEQLLKHKFAYKAYDSFAELEEQKNQQRASGVPSFRYDKTWLKISSDEIVRRQRANQYTIRLQLPKDKLYKWNDLVRGEIGINTDEIGDFIIQKQDGFPTYNFAVVIDDHDMEISHVLRGEEHITNTPKQLVLYDLLNWEAPQFGHLTIITNLKGQKLSKRDRSLIQFIDQYKKEQYDPRAIFNFLSLLGWTHPKAREIMSQEELILSFDKNRLSKSPSKFDLQKMRWFAKEYLRQTSNASLTKAINFSKKHDQKWIDTFLTAYKENAHTTLELQNIYDAIYKDPDNEKMPPNNLGAIFAKELLKVDFSVLGIKQALKKTQATSGLKGKDFFKPLRQITTLQKSGPELATAIYLFGPKIISKRVG